MHQTLVITDLTQMPRATEVCVCGINDRGINVRPVCSGGFLKKYLYDSKNQLIIRPSARIEFDFAEAKPEPPHIEDRIFNPSHIVSHGLCSRAEWEHVLRNSSLTKVSNIYSGLIQDNSWVKSGAKTMSIGTLSTPSNLDVQLPEREGRLRYRLSFNDNSDVRLDCAVSDLAFRQICFKNVIIDHRNRATVSNEITNAIKNTDRIYLRLGLARPWTQPGTTEPRCYLQVTGVYTFPDYLQGKTFADF